MLGESRQRKARKLAFYAIFSSDVGGMEAEETLKNLWEPKFSENFKREVEKKVLAWKNNSDSIDNVIRENLSRGTLNDLPTVARAALRLGLGEMEFLEEIPPKVAITEAVEITREYGDPRMAKFVNAVLDARYRAYKAVKKKGDQGGKFTEEKNS